MSKPIGIFGMVNSVIAGICAYLGASNNSPEAIGATVALALLAIGCFIEAGCSKIREQSGQ